MSENETAQRLLLSIDEAARLLNISPRTLWKYSQPRGCLPVVRIGCRTLYYLRNLERWIEAQQGVSEFLDTPEAKDKARYELKGWPNE